MYSKGIESKVHSQRFSRVLGIVPLALGRHLEIGRILTSSNASQATRSSNSLLFEELKSSLPARPESRGDILTGARPSTTCLKLPVRDVLSSTYDNDGWMDIYLVNTAAATSLTQTHRLATCFTVTIATARSPT